MAHSDQVARSNPQGYPRIDLPTSPSQPFIVKESPKPAWGVVRLAIRLVTHPGNKNLTSKDSCATV